MLGEETCKLVWLKMGDSGRSRNRKGASMKGFWVDRSRGQRTQRFRCFVTMWQRGGNQISTKNTIWGEKGLAVGPYGWEVCYKENGETTTIC